MFDVARRKHELENDEARTALLQCPSAKSSNLSSLILDLHESEVSPSFGSSYQSGSLRFEHLNERLLRNVDLPDAFHPFFSFLLFLQQFPFARDIAAVAFRGHVFSQRAKHFRAQ